MVSIIPGNARTAADLTGQQTANAIQQNVQPQLNQMYQRQRGYSAIDRLQQDLASANGDMSKILPAIARAYTDNPNLERSGIAEHAIKIGMAKTSENAAVPGDQQQSQAQPRNREPEQSTYQPQQLTGFLGQQGQQNFPTNIGPQGGPGQAPQAATTGQKQPLLDRQGKIDEARRVQKQNNAAGIPTTLKEAMAEVSLAEQDKKVYNTEVDAELAQRIEAQDTYGDKAVKYLEGKFPEATDEMKAIFQKKGEEASKRGDSQAEINRYLAKEADKFKNAISNVNVDLDAPRLQNTFQRALNGTYKNLEQAGNDARSSLQPILDLGLYDTARKMLAKKGYGIEESESIIHPLNVESNSILSQTPKIEIKKTLGKAPGQPGLGISFDRPQVDLNEIKSTLSELKKADPNFSLVLARKAFEDKGYNWREFKDALNEMQKEGFKLEDDQEIQKGYLNTPPLNLLERMLHGMNIIGS
jgi:hypothetical protein